MTGATALYGLGTPADLAHDRTQLHALIVAYAARQVVPCFNGRAVPSDYWASQRNGEQAKAAKQCSSCPAIVQCREYGLQNRNERGVYGGMTETERGHAL